MAAVVAPPIVIPPSTVVPVPTPPMRSDTVAIVSPNAVPVGGGGGDDKTFAFFQNTASALWSIVHNLHKHPSVTVQDTAGTQVIGVVDYVDNNSLTITFTAPFSGRADLN